jgi:hypothetical protein
MVFKRFKVASSHQAHDGGYGVTLHRPENTR